MKIAYTFGIIDILHYGHIRLLKEAKENNDKNIFGLIQDKVAKEWLGVLVSNYEERKKVLEGIRYIDSIETQETINPLKNLEKIHLENPESVITIYCAKKYANVIPTNFLKKINGKIKVVEYYSKLSNDNIYENIRKEISQYSAHANIISTKANTLLALSEKLKLSKIEQILVITVEDFFHRKDETLKKIKNNFSGKKIVVRSSSSNEDCFENSNAGHYESILNVDSKDLLSIENAIELVINSYTNDNIVGLEEQILIQTQSEDINYSGVLFTREINNNTPYYLINFDDNGTTDSVTSGKGGKSLYISKNCDLNKIPKYWSKLLESVYEIENLLDSVVLDIEFAINKKNEIIIFQVRPLAASYKFKKLNNDEKFLNKLKDIEVKYKTFHNINKETNIMLSDMAFWNPSEIIGSNPKKLDYTLYREIITKKSWNEGLVPLGYKKVNKDLMFQLGNKPYISVDDSFYSLLSSKLSDSFCKKLVNFYKEKLKKNIKLHDKIEFLIIPTCYDFSSYKFLNELLNNGFNEKEVSILKTTLKSLTKNYFEKFFLILESDLKDLKKLELSREIIELRENNKVNNIIGSIKKLLKDIQKYGTPQFSRQARFAFMARTICESLIHEGDVSNDKMNLFMLSIKTVASDFELDFNEFINGRLPIEIFNKKYGHLRSGTYNILAKRYDQIKFEKTLSIKKIEKEIDEINFSQKKIECRIAELGLDISFESFIEILKKSFEQREYFKFEFTKSLSLSIELIAKLGEILGLNRETMSYISIYDIFAIENYQGDILEFISALIKKRKEEHEYNTKLILPEVISNREDLYFVEISESTPNFITSSLINGELILLDEKQEQDIKGKIVVIEKADPGFDWIFAKEIKGLITKYGGVASHMAIRCAEFGIPAAIGCGEKIYNSILKFQKIKLDCKNKKIENEL